MEDRLDRLSDTELLGVINACLDALFDDRLRLPTEAEQLSLLASSLRIEARLRAWQAGLAAKIEISQAAWHEHGTSASSWLAQTANLTRREAARLILAGQGLDRFRLIGAAAASGTVLPAQAEAITDVLDGRPTTFRPRPPSRHRS